MTEGRRARVYSKVLVEANKKICRSAIVTDAGRDAMDAGQRTDERCCLADGEVVWS